MSKRNQYWVITTGKGMLPPGVKIGDIEAKTEDRARAVMIKFLQGRPLIWRFELKEE